MNARQEQAQDETDNSELMTFWEHVEELRKRLLIALAALLAATLGSFAVSEQVIYLLAEPIGSVDALQSIEVTENISVFMRVALLCGVTIAMPVILYELLIFILPALKANEKRWVYLAIVFGTLLFLAGAAFAYFIMLPSSLTFLVDFLAVETKPRLSSYINFITNLIFWMGIGFQFPLIVFALAKLNVVSARTLAKGWRYGVVIISILAAIITPTVDPINMALLMAPLCLLYMLSVFFAYLATRGIGPKDEDTPERNNSN
ncbi:MAG: twin-arginine translocase subunit TatC [Anaerolineae bacterium]|nr:twin-arginine translocase subunit TatC [Anaerolineae bacterium]